MWLAVDRIEAEIVVLMDDNETVYRLAADTYTALTGRVPVANTVLEAHVENGVIRSAVCDDDETHRRLETARARLARLVKRHK